MNDNEVIFSVVVSTYGRSHEVGALVESLQRQTERRWELIIIDQNSDSRVTDFLTSLCWSGPVVHVRASATRGLSAGRNLGWQRARGVYVIFADDDCWYPDWLFERTLQTFHQTHASIVTGRAADATGRSINGRYEKAAQKIDQNNVWTTSIEWMVFFRRTLLDLLQGYDESIGVGAATPWQSGEGQDILLRAIRENVLCYYDPALIGHHAELDTTRPTSATRAKARSYGRGMGFVLRKHAFGLASRVRWIARPVTAAVLYTARCQPDRAGYYLNMATGRLEGMMGRTLPL